MTFAFDPHLLPRPSDPDMLARHREGWLEAVAESTDKNLQRFAREVLADPVSAALLDAVFGNSPYLSDCLITEPAFLRRLLAEGADTTLQALFAELRAKLRPNVETDLVIAELRHAKRRIALLVALADIAGLWTLEQVCGALSRLAETALDLASAHLLHLAHEAGDIVLPHPDTPTRDSGLIILGMGKLGAEELNYSSDIDLIVFYDHEKIDYRGKRSVQETFVALTRELMRIISERTEDGYVFRTDLRLRPDPSSIPLALSVEAAEIYYEGFGQNWERAAMIKARPVAGDMAGGIAFIDFIRRFIWRKHLDFAAIQDIHSIKRQINAFRGGDEIAIAGHDIKVGRGGIREIEFFAQTQQLIWGGREPGLQSARTIEALFALARSHHVSARAATELNAAYRFLRKLEHRMQMTEDRQTQTVPMERDQRTALAIFMGFRSLRAFDGELHRMLRLVESHYAHLFEDAPPLAASGNLVFTGAEDDPATLATLASMGFTEPDSICHRIRGWHHGQVRATRSTRARELLTELTPSLLAALAKSAEPDAAFLRFDSFLAALPAGVQLFSLFHANPSLLDLVAEIMGDAPRLADHLSRKPALLDSVLSRDFYTPLPPLSRLEKELEIDLAETGGDFEPMLDVVRRWANEQNFQIGVQTLKTQLAPEAAAKHLTDIAEATIRCLLPRVAREFARQHGHMQGRGFALIALGKMGSREMTATSDLDLILVYDASSNITASNGARPLSPETYYARLTQRLISALTARTGEGLLYDVDMRLRPSGHAGPIATSLAAFRTYHRDAAWTWEHMALTRARVIAGPPPMRGAVRTVIRDALLRQRDPESLLGDVADMRERIAQEFPGQSDWDVKYRRGGLMDIDFIAQYIELRWAREHPSLVAASPAHMGTGQILEQAGQLSLLPAKDVALLQSGLHLWNAIQQVLRQTVEGTFDEDKAPGRLKEVLAKEAGLKDFAQLKTQMAARASAIFAFYEKLIGQPGRRIVSKQEKKS